MQGSTDVLNDIHDALEMGHRTLAWELYDEGRSVLSNSDRRQVEAMFSVGREAD